MTTEQRIEARRFIRENWESMTVKEIANHLEITDRTVANFARRMSLKPKRRTRDELAAARDMIAGLWPDHTIREIAEKVGMYRSSVAEHARRVGLPPKPAGCPKGARTQPGPTPLKPTRKTLYDEEQLSWARENVFAPLGDAFRCRDEAALMLALSQDRYRQVVVS